MQLEWIGLKIKLQGLFEKIKKVCFKNISKQFRHDGPNQWQRREPDRCSKVDCVKTSNFDRFDPSNLK